MKQKQDLFKDRVAVEMKLYFRQDFKRIGHSAKVARYAEKLVEKEKGDPAVVLTAAYLHDIGIREAERKHQSVDAAYQELEGPAIAREILTKLDAAEPLVDEVCDIIGHHHHPRDDETMNFKIVYDADLLSNLEEKHKKSSMEPQRLIELIESEFLTRSGKELAHEILCNVKSGLMGEEKSHESGTKDNRNCRAPLEPVAVNRETGNAAVDASAPGRSACAPQIENRKSKIVNFLLCRPISPSLTWKFFIVSAFLTKNAPSHSACC